MSSFVPPTYPKFGRQVRDLFKKKFEYDHIVKTVNKSSKGLTVESGAQLGSASSVRGFLKSKWVCEKSGEGELEISTDAAFESKANFKFTQLAKGFTANVSASSKDKDRAFKKAVYALELEHGQSNFAATATLKSDLDVHKLDSSVAVGSDGFSVGGSVSVDLSARGQVVDFNYGAEYANNEFTASVYTEKNASSLNASYWQRISSAHSLGALFRFDLTPKQERSLTLGNEYQWDSETSVKSKVDLPSGDIAVAVEHAPKGRGFVLGVATQFNGKASAFQADKLGVQITF